MTLSDAPELLRASIFHTPGDPFRSDNVLESFSDGGLLIRNGRIVACGEYTAIRDATPEATTLDMRGGFIIPGFIDTHVHYPQLRVLGGLGRSLLDWLEHCALPEEARMADLTYARETAHRFLHALASHGTTTALTFGAHFAPAMSALFKAADQSGLRILTGLVMADRNLRPDLHQTPEGAYQDSSALIRNFHRRGRLHYAVTPRFALSASEAMLEVCQTLVRENEGVRIQTHINENIDEIAYVSKLFPWASDYFAVYERYGLSGPGAVMAHSVHTKTGELERMAATRTAVAHCPCSNASLASGIFPLRRHLNAGVHCSLGTDVGGGTGFGMMKEALQAYLMQRITSDGFELRAAHLLYLATLAGAEAVGLAEDIGDFRSGKAADFVYLKPAPDSPLAAVLDSAETPERALAAIFTLAGQESVREVRVEGDVVYRSQAA